jgi:hypothetical protein
VRPPERTRAVESGHLARSSARLYLPRRAIAATQPILQGAMSDVASDLPRPELFRLVATLRFREAEDGGRKGPVASGYRPNCWFGLLRDGEHVYNDCVLHFRPGGDAYQGPEDLLWVPPGGRCVADVSPLYASYVRRLVHVGSTFAVCEGGRVVADAEVRDVFDPGPELDLG